MSPPLLGVPTLRVVKWDTAPPTRLALSRIALDGSPSVEVGAHFHEEKLS
ncbi:MAG: hypothetical protein ABIO70_20115 [Pseudomonadota bacterium]